MKKDIKAISDNTKHYQSIINKIVNQMVEDGFPVEAVHKIDHTKDFIPGYHFSWENKEFNSDHLAMALVGGWFSVAALTNLFRILCINEINKRTLINAFKILLEDYP